MSGLTVAAALAEARALGIERLDAQLLLSHLSAKPRTWVLAHDDAMLDADAEAAWSRLAARRSQGEPLAYLLGAKEFHGLMLHVDASVLVPRPETELLVDRALEILRSPGTNPRGVEHDPRMNPRVLDLGTGSGAIALALKAAWPAARVCASDQSTAALDVARANAHRLGLDVEFRAGSWWTPWSGERFEFVLSNPPYVADGDPHLAALSHEPVLALMAGREGLDALRSIIGGAAAHLERDGWLWLEHGFEQADAVQALLHAAGFSGVQTRPDLAGQPRCSGGRLDGPA
ncbi:MAG: peptide chain release factor N(5)-glutamine methyltransferase [Caldimonas sp.]